MSSDSRVTGTTAARRRWRDLLPSHRLRLPDLAAAMSQPASVFARPSDVAHHLLLTGRQKREILMRWLSQERERTDSADSPLAQGILRALTLISPGGPRPGPCSG